MRIRAGAFPEPHAPDLYERVLSKQGFGHDREVVRRKRNQGTGTDHDREDPGTRFLLQHRKHVRAGRFRFGMSCRHGLGTRQELGQHRQGNRLAQGDDPRQVRRRL